MNPSALSAAVLQRGGLYPTICGCCRQLFHARSVLAVWCSDACRRRAGYYRRSGRPIPAKGSKWTQPIRPQVLQPEIPPAQPAGLEVRQWNGTPIERRPDGYVNATAMCKANGKHLPHYLANDRTDEYLQALSAVVGTPTTELVRSTRGGVPGLQGTWVHARVAVDLARWVSPAFAVWMDGWFLEALAAPAPPQAHIHTQPLPEGVHVVAATRRRAAELWWQAIESEVSGALSRRLNPTHRTDAGLPLVVSYQWQQLSLIGR